MATSSLPSPPLLMNVTSELVLGWTQGSPRRPGDIGKQRTMERLSTFALKPTIEPTTGRQHWRAGQTSAHGRGWRTDCSSLAIIFDDIDNNGWTERQPGFTVKPTIEPKTAIQHRRAGGRPLNSEAGERTVLLRLSPSTISASNGGRNCRQASLSSP